MSRSSSFTTELAIGAPPDVVWRALTQPSGRRGWMNDAEVVSSWAPGSDITIAVVLEGRMRHDRGTVVDAAPPVFLRYSLWSSISRRSDRPEHRSTVTFRLAPTRIGGTLVTVVHDGLGVGPAVAHAAFFWPVALGVLRDELEGRAPGPLALRDLGA